MVLAGHHARMNPKTTSRCCQCSRSFCPDPRVGHRQVTCGEKSCQRKRHAQSCKSWHQENREASRFHYIDVIIPFRTQQPDYQRRWRLSRKLRKIRDEIAAFEAQLTRALKVLLRGAQKLTGSSSRAVQSGVLAGDLLENATVAICDSMAALHELGLSAASWLPAPR